MSRFGATLLRRVRANGWATAQAISVAIPVQNAAKRWSSSLKHRQQSNSKLKLSDMEIPTCERQQYISFYKYTKVDPKELPQLRKSMLKEWRDFGVMGRVYIAEEGINAQITVPVSQYDVFQSHLKNHQHDLFKNVFYNSGGELHEQNNDREPFRTLHVRVRPHLANDGLTIPLDMSERGKELTPEEWHEALTDGREKRIFDCRNYYEHDVGRFENAERIMVETFKETFDTLDEMLKDTSKETPCMIYCTGGIRCEKVGAYLKQKGFSTVERLEGGIVHYAQYITKNGVESKFKGRNFVFDERLSNINTTITDDVLATCYTCGAPCNTHTNCSNTLCHGLILLCSNCTQQYDGACSTRCQNMKYVLDRQTREKRRLFSSEYAYQFQHHLVPNGRVRPGLRPAQRRDFSTHQCAPSDALNQYIVDNSSIKPTHNMLQNIRVAIEKQWPEEITNKMIPEAQAVYMQFLLQSLRAESVLEIGCFGGYSALAMSLALPSPQNIITCDIDEEAHAWTRKYFESNNIPIDLRLRDGLSLVEDLGVEKREFDFIFIDGNKSSYMAIYEAILHRGLLSRHGMLMFDNTLFRGQVLEHAMGRGHAKEKIANRLMKFNHHVTQDPRTRNYVVPMWDGLTIVQLNNYES